MAYCIKCGAKLPEKAEYCTKCGTPIKSSDVPIKEIKNKASNTRIVLTDTDNPETIIGSKQLIENLKVRIKNPTCTFHTRSHELQ